MFTTFHILAISLLKNFISKKVKKLFLCEAYIVTSKLWNFKPHIIETSQRENKILKAPTPFCFAYKQVTLTKTTLR
jgi:hypothetical protein